MQHNSDRTSVASQAAQRSHMLISSTRSPRSPAPRLDRRCARVAQLRHGLQQRARQVQLRKAGRREARAVRRLRKEPAGGPVPPGLPSAAGPRVGAAPPPRRLRVLLRGRPAPARLTLHGVPVAGGGRVSAVAAAVRAAPQPAFCRRGAAPRSGRRLLAVAAGGPAELLVVLILIWLWLLFAAVSGLSPVCGLLGGLLAVALVVQLAGQRPLFVVVAARRAVAALVGRPAFDGAPGSRGGRRRLCSAAHDFL